MRHRRPDSRFAPQRWCKALVVIALTMASLLVARSAQAADVRRDAWVVSAAGVKPAVMLGPTVGFLPLRALGIYGDEFEDSTSLALCTEQGCAAVIQQRQIAYDADLHGLLLSVPDPLADVTLATSAAQVLAALQQTRVFADFTSGGAVPRPEMEMPNSLSVDRIPPVRRKRRPSRPKMSWEDGGRWRAEVGAMGGVSLLVDREDKPTTARAGGSARLGFRYRLRSRNKYVDLLRGLLIGQQVGADVRAHYFGVFEEESLWAVTVNPTASFLLPIRSKASVLGRLPALAGPFGIGVAGRGRRASLGFQIGTDFALLVTPRFGLDFRFSATVSPKFGLIANLGLGGFFR